MMYQLLLITLLVSTTHADKKYLKKRKYLTSEKLRENEKVGSSEKNIRKAKDEGKIETFPDSANTSKSSYEDDNSPNMTGSEKSMTSGSSCDDSYYDTSELRKCLLKEEDMPRKLKYWNH